MNDSRVVIYAFDDNLWMRNCSIVFAMVIVGESLACTILAVLSFYELRVQSSNLSIQTAQQQKNFLISLCLQVTHSFFYEKIFRH